MKCPFCGKEMINGAVKSAREIIFTKNTEKKLFKTTIARDEEFSLSSNNLGRPTCVAYHCPECRKVIIDYSMDEYVCQHSTGR